MTVNNTQSSVTYTGDGSATVFAYSFLVPEASDFLVQITDLLGNVSTINSGQYSVTGVGGPAGGNLTYPLSGAALANGYLLTISRVIPLTQPTTLNNQGSFYPQVIEAALDRLTLICQQISAAVFGVLRTPPQDTNPIGNLPPVAARAGQVLGFDSSGNPIAAGSSTALSNISEYVADAEAAAVSAAASAAAAAGYSPTSPQAQYALYSAAGSQNFYYVVTGTAVSYKFRWGWGKDESSESGGNAGANFILAAYDDNGNALGEVFDVTRSTKVLNFAVQPKIGGVNLLDYIKANLPNLLAAAGDIKFRASLTIPTGWLECNGSAISRTTYSALFTALGTVWGAGDGSTTFNLPDMRGYVPRGWDHGAGRDSGRSFGTYQADAFQDHGHSLGSGIDISTVGPAGLSAGTMVTGGNVSSILSGGASSGNVAAETRMKNAAGMFIIYTGN